MGHLPHLITDLALILAVAAITTLIFKKIRQPVVLGYMLAGFLVSPHVSLVPTVADSEGIQIWSEIGVIFLLFSLGLEFSFKKLSKVGGSACITALIGVTIMNALGMLAGHLLGWSTMSSIFLGSILSISSTTIIMRAFEEVGVRTKKFAALVMGVLIIQDFVAVILLVLLSTLAVSRQFEGLDLLMQILKLLAFLTLWFTAGIYFIPTFLKRIRGMLNDETILILSIALCLVMVWLAVKVGFSAALGAFTMGSILAETTQAERIEQLVKPVQNLFAAVFFISVGMMIDPSVLVAYAPTIGIITVLIITGMTLSFSFGAIIAGQSLKHSIQAGMSLAQIGEFSFIIASLGVALNVTESFLYPVTVAAAAATTFTTPFMVKSSGSVYVWLESHLPRRLLGSLNRYSISSQQLSAYSEWRELLNGYMINATIHSAFLGVLSLLSYRYLQPLVANVLNNALTANIVSIFVTLLLMVPFIWALAIRRIKKEAYSNLWLNRKMKRGPLIALEISRIALAVLHVGILVNIYFSLTVAFVIALLAITIAIAVFNRKLQAFYERIEHRFLTNLNAREKPKIMKHEITPWDAHLATFEVPHEFKLAGRSLHELRFREKYGVNVALIERGKLALITPDRYERLYPGDKLSIIGTDDQLSKIKFMFEDHFYELPEPEVSEDQIALQNVKISKDSRLNRQTIRHSGIRKEARALVIGLERNGERILNPESSTEMIEGDIVWIVGVKEKIEKFLRT
jgi:monovalent cation:H+ antiporter-2, CPA2 family